MSEVGRFEETVVKTICNTHCGGTCDFKVHVQGGKIVRIEAGGDEQERRHRACAKVRAYRQRVYHPDRLLFPLRRSGKRGSGEFARISWDEALDTVVDELKRVKAAYGNASILHFCSFADAFTVHSIQAFHRLLCMFGGYTAPWGTISNEGENFAAATTFGTKVLRRDEEQWNKTRLIILWGWNPVATNQGSEYNLLLLQAKENGAKCVLVDPRYSSSGAAYADQWIPIRPGTDTAVLAAMAYVIVTENLHDHPFIERHVSGFGAFVDYLAGVEDRVNKTPEWAEAISGVPAATIAELAREYAGNKLAILAEGLAPGRTAYGEQFHRAVYALNAITGNIDTRYIAHDATASLRYKAYRTPSPPNAVETGSAPRWNALPSRGSSVNSSARVNTNLFADALIKGTAGGYGADYKFLWLSNTNYLNQLGDVNRGKEALQKPDFILVTEQFLTATARFADVIFPVCTFLERNDFFAELAGGGSFANPESYGVVRKAIEPLGESKSPLEICEALAARLGITAYSDKTDEEWVRFKIARLSEVTAFPEYDRLAEGGQYFPQTGPVGAQKNATEEADQPEGKMLPTPSGKIEIQSQVIASMNHPQLPSLPKYIETWESPASAVAGKYPLQLISPHHRWRAHSQFDNLPWLRSLSDQRLSISARDAERRGIRDGDAVRVYNDRGEVIIPCRVTERIMPGVVALPQGAWYAADAKGVDRGGCANTLTRNATSPAGASVNQTALVQVERAT